MNIKPQLLRTADAAKHCGFAKSTFEKWRSVSGGPPFIRRGKAVYYSIDDLADWLANLPRFANTSEADVDRAP